MKLFRSCEELKELLWSLIGVVGVARRGSFLKKVFVRLDVSVAMKLHNLKVCGGF
jgi:hypothetical protein